MKIKRKYSFNQLLSRIDQKIGLGKLEYLLSTNWFNPFLTLYFNLRSFPFRQAIYFPIFVYGHPRIYGLSGKMKIEGNKVKTGMIRFNMVMPGAPCNNSVNSEIFNEGTIIFHGKGEIGTGTKIRVAFNAELNIGHNFKITDMCNIGCLKKITIGDESWIVHRCQIFDSNYHYIENMNNHSIPFMAKEVVIGERCWICNSSSIMPGVIIPNNTIIASNSLVTKDYRSIPEYSIIGGVPAKLISNGYTWLKSGCLQNKVAEFYKLSPNGMYYKNESSFEQF